MASPSAIAANTPPPNPSELAMFTAGGGAQAAADPQDLQNLAQVLAAMRDQAKDIRTPIAAGADPLAEALIQRRYGPSMLDRAQTAPADPQRAYPPALSQPDQPSGAALYAIPGYHQGAPWETSSSGANLTPQAPGHWLALEGLNPNVSNYADPTLGGMGDAVVPATATLPKTDALFAAVDGTNSAQRGAAAVGMPSYLAQPTEMDILSDAVSLSRQGLSDDAYDPVADALHMPGSLPRRGILLASLAPGAQISAAVDGSKFGAGHPVVGSYYLLGSTYVTDPKKIPRGAFMSDKGAFVNVIVDSAGHVYNQFHMPDGKGGYYTGRDTLFERDAQDNALFVNRAGDLVGYQPAHGGTNFHPKVNPVEWVGDHRQYITPDIDSEALVNLDQIGQAEDDTFAGIGNSVAWALGANPDQRQGALYAGALGGGILTSFAGQSSRGALSVLNVNEPWPWKGPGAKPVRSPNRAARKLANSSGAYLSPSINAVVETEERLAADHFIPQSWIRSRLGFYNMDLIDQSDLLNHHLIIEGLPQSLNASKGPQMPGEWVTYKGQPLDQNYIRDSADLADLLRNYIELQIKLRQPK